MAKVKGPLLSFQGKGDFQNTLLFQKLGGLNVVREKNTGVDRKSTKQLAQRALYSTGTDLWQALSGDLKALWNEKVKSFFPHHTGFNYFMHQFMDLGEEPSPWWYPEMAVKNFKLIEEVSLVNANDYTFSGLDGNVQELFKLEIEGYLTAAADKIVGLRPNGAITNYAKGAMFFAERAGGSVFNHNAGIWTGTTEILPLGRNGWGANGWIFLRGFFSGKSGLPRLINSYGTFLRDSALHDYIIDQHLVNAWLNTTDNITSLVLHFGGATNFSGKAYLFAFY